MGKKKPVLSKKPAKQTTPKAEPVETKPEPQGRSSAEIFKKIIEDLGNDTSFAIVVAGADGAIIPSCAAKNIGDLLTLKYVLDKEIEKVVNGSAQQSKQS